MLMAMIAIAFPKPELFGQGSLQTIKGTVIDKQTQSTFTAASVEVTAGKQVVPEIGLEESAGNLGEMIVRGGSTKHETVNELAAASGRSFTMEKVNRYSGGRSDPSRLTVKSKRRCLLNRKKSVYY